MTPINSSRRYGLAVGPAAVLASAGLIVASLFVDNREPLDTVLFRIGTAVMMLAATVWVVARGHATEQQIECIRQHAYDDGYADGCEVSRVVELRPRSSGVAVPVLIAGDGAAQQLGDERNVGHGA